MTLIVSVSDSSDPGTQTEITGEMTVGEPEFGVISEMVTDSARLDNFVPGASAKAAAMATACSDETPEFAVVRIEEGMSGSKRLWGGGVLDSIAEQVNRLEPVGHLGHIRDEDESTIFPEPQTTWLGAVTKDEPSLLNHRKGKVVRVFYAAGYNHAGAKIRNYIKSKSVRGVSWWGRGEQRPIPGKGVEVINFTLKHLDWARKGAEGMPSTSIVAIASEMTGGTIVADKALSAITPEEFAAENPNAHKLIVAAAQADGDQRIAEMEEEVEAAKVAESFMSKVRKLLGLKDDDTSDPYEALVTMFNRLGDEAKLLTGKALDKVLAKEVPDEDKRKVVKRLLQPAMGEMEKKVANLPTDADEDAVEKIIGEMYSAQVDTDDILQNIIGEQTAPSIRRTESLRQKDGGDKNYPGMERGSTKL